LLSIIIGVSLQKGKINQMKKVILLLLTVIISLGLSAQARWNYQYQQYINQYKDLAIEQMLRYHIPASITLAQGLLESRAGLSTMTIRSNNHFGIKCHGWTGGTFYQDDDDVNECFRAYDNAYDSYEDHSKFLVNSQRYRSLFSLDVTDYKGWAYGLKQCGYATNPNYALSLINIIQLYKLDEFDSQRNYDKFIARRTGHDRSSAYGVGLHPIYMYNKNYYLKARSGDTFKSIGKEVDIPRRALARYNERDKDDILSPGDIVYLKKKRRKADKAYKKVPHIVRPGQSMYDIAQIYGIRLKYLYKMNNLPPDYQIKVGDTLRVR